MITGKQIRGQIDSDTIKNDIYIRKAGPKHRRHAMLSILNSAREGSLVKLYNKDSKLLTRWLQAADVNGEVNFRRLSKWLAFQNVHGGTSILDEVNMQVNLKYLFRLGQEHRFLWLVFAVGESVKDIPPSTLMKTIGTARFIRKIRNMSERDKADAIPLAVGVALNEITQTYWYKEFEKLDHQISE